MNKKTLALTTGFALFSMFFGSGNLVFPIAIGQETPDHSILACFGILLTGVLVPFLGVYGISLFHGSIQDFFKVLGKSGPFWFSLLALGLMGPFGVMARCLTVAHGSIQLLWPEATLVYTSLAQCFCIYALTHNRTKIVHVLGSLLTPLLLGSIILLAYFGLINPAEVNPTSSHAWYAFQNGFLQGYQTMDLLAAFFFSRFIIQHLESLYPESDTHSRHKALFASSLVGAGLLSIVYIIMVALGSHFTLSLGDLPPQEMLAEVALKSLGGFAGPVLCLAVVLACLTTAMVLASLFASFIDQEIFSGRLGDKKSLFITLLIGFLVSTLDFAGIARFLGPILELAYPSLIVLTLVNIAHAHWKTPLSYWPAAAMLLIQAVFYFIS